MCGIAGAIENIHCLNKYDFSKNSEFYITIANRGPDFYNFKTILKDDSWQITLAHSRLAIIDLSSSSNQPMISENGRYTLSYNGEIYNYLEIKEELTKLGINFKTKGDTEVVLKSWEKWGNECLHKFNGMFAFAIYDNVESELTLVRDRFGVKPLVYGFDANKNFLFSSSVKAVGKAINSNYDFSYCATGLKFGYFEGNDNKTIYEQVKYVEPGSLIKIKIAHQLNISTYTWYNIDEEINKKIELFSNKSIDYLLEYSKELFDSAVKLRLRCDVKLAISLSGGLDSSSIAAVAKKYNENITAFAYGSPSSELSEGPVVQKFAHSTGINVNYIYPNYSAKELGDIYDQTLQSQEAPFLELSIIAQHIIYKTVKEFDYKILLGGQGGDEIFAGYRKFFLFASKESFIQNKFIESFGYILSLAKMMYAESNQLKIYWNARNRYLNTKGNHLNIISNFPEENIKMLSGNELYKRQILDITKYSLPTLLRFEDRNSMFYSIENRLPFMDYRLVEFAIALPTYLKINNGYSKWFLRLMMENSVPSYILKNRNKRGFDVSQNWVKEGVGQRIITNILDNKTKAKEFVSDLATLENKITVDKLCNFKTLNEAIMLNFLTQ